jgi:hypothetical protein
VDYGGVRKDNAPHASRQAQIIQQKGKDEIVKLLGAQPSYDLPNRADYVGNESLGVDERIKKTRPIK